MAAVLRRAAVALLIVACFAVSGASAEEHDMSVPAHVIRARDLAIIESITASKSVPCNISAIGTAGGVTNEKALTAQTACGNFVWNATSGTVVTGGGTGSKWRAEGNIDPPFGSLVPKAADGYKIPAGPSNWTGNGIFVQLGAPTGAYTAMVGLAVAPQVGWGGGPDVPMGPPLTNVVWGVHSTPATHAAASGDASVLISWMMGNGQQNVAGTIVKNGGSTSNAGVIGALNGPSNASASFVPVNTTFVVTINVGKDGAALTAATLVGQKCIQYLRIEPSVPTAKLDFGGRTYLSPYVCHATVTGLSGFTIYNFTISTAVTTPAGCVGPAPCGATTTYSTPTDTVATGTSTYSFKTISKTAKYPFRMIGIADIGVTYHSSLTAQFAAQYILNNADKGGVDVVVNVGDLTYGDNYGVDNMYPDAENSAGAGANPLKWDQWAPMIQPLFGRASVINAAGNHEMESNIRGTYNPGKYTDTSKSLGFLNSDPSCPAGPNCRYPYQAYAARFPSGAQAAATYGDVWQVQYFAQDLGPVHLIVLANYIPFVAGTEQYNWFVKDIQAVDRAKTPWLVVAFHVPPYHTYLTHFKEAECFLSQYESLFYQYKVDIVLNGHIHAYERTHPVYQYKKDACGPVYLTLGDGGNTEGPYRNYMDETINNSTTTYCAAASASVIKAGVANGNTWTPSYQIAAQPPTCPTLSFQPSQNAKAGFLSDPGVLSTSNPTGVANSKTFWCQNTQPEWSAYRDPSFGFSAIKFTSDTTAEFAWYRNADQNTQSTVLTAVDKVTWTKTTDTCSTPITTVTTSGNKQFSTTVNTDGSTTIIQTTTGATVTGAAFTMFKTIKNADGVYIMSTTTAIGAIPAGTPTATVLTTFTLSVAFSATTVVQQATLAETVCATLVAGLSATCTATVGPTLSRRRSLLAAGDTLVTATVTAAQGATVTTVLAAATAPVATNAVFLAIGGNSAAGAALQAAAALSSAKGTSALQAGFNTAGASALGGAGVAAAAAVVASLLL